MAVAEAGDLAVGDVAVEVERLEGDFGEVGDQGGFLGRGDEIGLVAQAIRDWRWEEVGQRTALFNAT